MSSLVLQPFELRLALALALGAVLGVERQLHHRAAGTRTNALVALGAALFVLLGQNLPGDAAATGRVAGQVITGIGFLGAGAILREGTTIVGLTTAATVWCAAGVGMLAGLGNWYEACLGTLFVLAANVLLRPLDRFIDRLATRAAPVPATQRYRLRLELAAPPTWAEPPLPAVLALLTRWLPQALRVTETAPPRVHADVHLPAAPDPAFAQLLAALAAVPGVERVSGEMVMEEGSGP